MGRSGYRSAGTRALHIEANFRLRGAFETWAALRALSGRGENEAACTPDGRGADGRVDRYHPGALPHAPRGAHSGNPRPLRACAKSHDRRGVPNGNGLRMACRNAENTILLI